ncbi:MAG: 3'(2'),5'-bisphosphate nucleotidase CysQ [Candidatus Dormibacteria bacterium]|jgi:3'(2'), 5'-bisphosphate nucleotidase
MGDGSGGRPAGRGSGQAHAGQLDETVVSDHELAGFLADEAGQTLMALRARAGDLTPSSLRDQGDRLSHLLLTAALARLRPDDAVLSEEGADDPSRVGASRVWIIDPLDGTREFGEPGRSDWAVHVALVVGGVPVAAAVSLPARGVVISTADPPSRPVSVRRRLRLMVSRSHTPPQAIAIAEHLDAEIVYMGSAGAKTMAVVLGEADAYVHLGGQYEWDSAAPVGVALAAGLSATRIDGSPLRYNQANPWLPDQVVCRPELREVILATLRALGSEAA